MAKDKEANKRVDGAVEAKPVSKKWRIVVAIAGVVVLSSAAGGYFAFETFAATPLRAEAADLGTALPSGPMPAATIVAASPVRAQDYQIVSVFDAEAILATADNLIRLKVGSLAQGLGTITSIEAAGDGGGTVVGSEATLRTS